MTSVIGYPRLHAGLFDLGTATSRQYGGIGMALDDPRTVVSARPAPRFSIEGISVLDAAAAVDVDNAVARLSTVKPLPSVSVTVCSVPPQHVGLGTKTTLILAILKAISVAGNLDLSEADLRKASGRGGTSGVGVYTFFDGGLVIDGGHRSDPPRRYAPSSSGPPLYPPPLIARIDMPVTWRCTLLLPEGTCLAGTRETAAFEALTPVPDEEVRSTISLAVMGLAASAAAGDFSAFAMALREMQLLGFKAREIAAQPEPVAELLRELSRVPQTAAGMSSMGPLLFAISDGCDPSFDEQVETIARRRRAQVLCSVGFRNRGFHVE